MDDFEAFANAAIVKGHCHPDIVATLVQQAQKLTLSSRAFYNSVFGAFAQQITTMFGYDMVLPMNTGAEAVETAVKLSRKWGYQKKGIPDGKAVVLSVAGNFHGRTLAVIRSVLVITNMQMSYVDFCFIQYEHGS
jgi:ornithine--oxo-acid transaminase